MVADEGDGWLTYLYVCDDITRNVCNMEGRASRDFYENIVHSARFVFVSSFLFHADPLPASWRYLFHILHIPECFLYRTVHMRVHISGE